MRRPHDTRTGIKWVQDYVSSNVSELDYEALLQVRQVLQVVYKSYVDYKSFNLPDGFFEIMNHVESAVMDWPGLH